MPAHVTAEQMINWTTPPDFQITPHCTSDAEYHELRGWVAVERQAWLLDISKRRLDQMTEFESQRGLHMERQSPEPESGDPDRKEARQPKIRRPHRPAHWDLPIDVEPVALLAPTAIDFKDIPAKFVLTRDEHNEIVADEDNLRHDGRWVYGSNFSDRKRPWMILAALQVELQGNCLTSSKYDERLYQPNYPRQLYRAALKRSEEISTSGYPIRFLMDGVRYVQQSALDLTTVQTWIDNRDTIDYEPVYNTQHGFWPTLIASKRRLDEENGVRTFADQVIEVDNGLYLGQYLPDAVKQSGEYLTFDDAYRIAKRYGNKETGISRSFKAIIMASISSEEQRKAVHWHCFDTPYYLHSGVLMLHRDRINQAVEKLHDEGDNIVKILSIADLIAETYAQASQPSAYQDLYNQLVLGKA